MDLTGIGIGEMVAFVGLAMSIVGSHLRQQQQQEQRAMELKAEITRLTDAINHNAERVNDRFLRIDEKLVEAEASRARLGVRIGTNERNIAACEKRHDISEALLRGREASPA